MMLRSRRCWAASSCEVRRLAVTSLAISMKPITCPCASCAGCTSVSTHTRLPCWSWLTTSTRQPVPAAADDFKSSSDSGFVWSLPISTPGVCPIACSRLWPYKRVKASLTHVMRSSRSVMMTAFEVPRATSASRASSAVMPSASASARRRPVACCHSNSASNALARLPTANASGAGHCSTEASNDGVARTRRVMSRPGSGSVRTSSKAPTRAG